MGIRLIDQAEADDFLKKCQEAERDLKNKDALLDKVYSDFEQGITLLGATAVEDRLQDDVPRTIADL